MAFVASTILGRPRADQRQRKCVRMMATPVAEFDKVWMKVKEGPSTTESGILIKTDELNEAPKTLFGKVIAAGPGDMMDNGEYEPHDVKVGKTVIFNENMGREITLDGEKFMVIRVKDVVAAFDSTLNL